MPKKKPTLIKRADVILMIYDEVIKALQTALGQEDGYRVYCNNDLLAEGRKMVHSSHLRFMVSCLHFPDNDSYARAAKHGLCQHHPYNGDLTLIILTPLTGPFQVQLFESNSSTQFEIANEHFASAISTHYFEHFAKMRETIDISWRLINELKNLFKPLIDCGFEFRPKAESDHNHCNVTVHFDLDCPCLVKFRASNKYVNNESCTHVEHGKIRFLVSKNNISGNLTNAQNDTWNIPVDQDSSKKIRSIYLEHTLRGRLVHKVDSVMYAVRSAFHERAQLAHTEDMATIGATVEEMLHAAELDNDEGFFDLLHRIRQAQIEHKVEGL